MSGIWGALFIAGVGLPWIVRAAFKKKRLPVMVTVDPDDPRPSDVARYLAEIAARLDERPEKMRVVFNAPAGLVLDMEADGRLAVKLPGRRTCRFELRSRWIADHPVPLDLGTHRLTSPFGIFSLRRFAVLYVDPVDSNRFRVSDRRFVPVPFSICPFLSLGATLAAVFMSPEIFLLVAGLALGCATIAFIRPSGRRICWTSDDGF